MLNNMCKSCKCLNTSCSGTECQVWTGCVYYQNDPAKKLELQKTNALEEYKIAKEKYLQEPSSQNWKFFCDKKQMCMFLGVRI